MARIQIGKYMSTAKQSVSRLFTLVRSEDVSGTSGVGVVAEGVEFSDGTCVLHWISQLRSIEICDNLFVVDKIHGHDGRTKIVFYSQEVA
jgi:hypothetical protein